jgi:hypothetical protein
LDHRCRIDIDLYGRLPFGQNIPLEMQRDVQDESVTSVVHQAIDIAQGDRLRRIEIWGQQKALDDAMRKLRIVLVDDRDRRVVKFLRIALRLGVNRERECPDDQSDQDVIVHETAQFLGSEPDLF